MYIDSKDSVQIRLNTNLSLIESVLSVVPPKYIGLILDVNKKTIINEDKKSIASALEQYYCVVRTHKSV